MSVATSSDHCLLARLAGESGVHAVLFYGSPGAAQDRLARDLAAAYLCEAPGREGACGECRSCGAVSRGTNADLQEIRPQGAGQVIRQRAILDDKTEGVTVPVRDFVRTGPLMSRNKVCVFYQADRMNAAAANAFLKTLEEPQAFAKFILVTDSIGRILPTVLSRCLTIPCELPSLDIRGALGKAYAVVPQFASLLDDAKFAEFEGFVMGWGAASPISALRKAEELEDLASHLESEGSTERQAIANALELCATLAARQYPQHPEWTQELIHAHRRILGNVHAGRVLDALFTKILA